MPVLCKFVNGPHDGGYMELGKNDVVEQVLLIEGSQERSVVHKYEFQQLAFLSNEFPLVLVFKYEKTIKDPRISQDDQTQ